MPEWTLDQKRVITSDAKELICSAAAGSGKTAVLVERVARLIREGADPKRFLIMTFTNAAASEMKEKIRRRLSEEKTDIMQDALDRISLMQISTIHSWCQRLICEEFQFIGVDPRFRICESSVKKALFSKAVKEACNQLYEMKDPDYLYFTSANEKRKAEEMADTVYSFIMSLPDPYGWLKKKADSIPEKVDPEHPWFSVLSELTAEKVRKADFVLAKMELLLADSPEMEPLRKVIEADRLMFHVEQGKARPEKWMTKPVLKNLTPDEKEREKRFTNLRNGLKDLFRSILQYEGRDTEKDAADFLNVKRQIRGLCRITETAGRLFREEKIRNKVLDFNDLEQMTLEILNDEQHREGIRDEYDWIFVDECQDVSAVQDRIIQLLHGGQNALFMVGDVKQSIYRFRRADPTLFMNRVEEYLGSGDKGKQCIYLQQNFRSRPEILETVNTVFASAMRKKVTELDYTESERLKPGRNCEGNIPVEIDLLGDCPAKDGEDTRSNLEKIADRVATRIKEFLTQPREDGSRCYQYRDMVILMPAVSAEGEPLREMLEQRGIPVYFDGKDNYYQLEEIALFREILKVTDCPEDDNAMLSVLKQSPFLMTDQELAEIRKKKSAKNTSFCSALAEMSRENSPLGVRCRTALEKIAEWHRESENRRLPDLFWYLFEETGCYAMSGMNGTGSTARANLRMLCEQAAKCEENGILTLREFLAWTEEESQSGDTREACSLGEKDDLVRIMTMHKSKGLQFPVVFCLGLDRPISHISSPDVRCDSELGLCMKYRNPELRIARPTLADEVFTWKKERDEKAERARVLYVGMTRAQERMILVSAKTSDPVWSLPEGDDRTAAADTYIDWVVPPLFTDANKKMSTGYAQPQTGWNIGTYSDNKQKDVDKKKDIHNVRERLETGLRQNGVEELWTKLTEETVSRQPVKRSVTSLLRDRKTQLSGEDEETPEEKRKPDAIRRISDELPEKPAFMQEKKEMTGAWRGTVIHRVFSLIDLKKIREAEDRELAVEEEIRRIREGGYFTEEEKKLVFTEPAAVFFRSEIGQRMLNGENMRREWNFNLVTEQEGEEILLQGVLDCAFTESGEWVILDYKTDRITDEEEFRSKYAPQLGWYAEALRKLTGKKVRECVLWSISLGREFRLDTEGNPG